MKKDRAETRKNQQPSLRCQVCSSPFPSRVRREWREELQAELEEIEERIQAKQREVEDLLIQILSFKNLMKRNRERVANLGAPSQNSAISLPFLVVNTGKKTTIDCSISSDKSEYVFNFDNAFELHNDIDVLKKMGLDCGLHSGQWTADDLNVAKSMLPKGFESTVDDIAKGKKVIASSSCPNTPSSISNSVHLTSTPTNAAVFDSPSPLSPLLHSQASPLALAAAFNQLKAAVAASPIGVANSPGQNARSSLINLASPQAVTALVNEALKGAKSGQMVSSLQPTASLCANQLGVQTTPMSPLVKSMGPVSPVHGSASPGVSIPNGSPHSAKSPAPKIVTVSKFPSVMTIPNDHITSLLQSLEQSPLKVVIPCDTNGHTSDVDPATQSPSNGVA
ncbi:Transcription factor Dp-1 [Geodia barretti]|uniref:Transcription factor Dp-1 n=1 Tax=Geodia barretti TaxID=519541 RepID=A0AA35TQK5_GEOBA|nr:Transcription factor Dp-1 [Geodia barretti]